MARERDKNVANDDAGFVRGPFEFNFEDDGGGFVVALQRFSKSIRQTYRLQTDAKIATRDAAFLQKRVDDAIHGGRRNGDGTEARETRCGDADDSALWVNDRAANSGGLHADVEPNVRGKRCARPGAPLRYNQANGPERGYGAAGACASDNKRETARLD